MAEKGNSYPETRELLRKVADATISELGEISIRIIGTARGLMPQIVDYWSEHISDELEIASCLLRRPTRRLRILGITLK